MPPSPSLTGTYSSAVGATDIAACVECNSGTYSESMGATDGSVCKNCPATTHRPLGGGGAKTSLLKGHGCENCALGYFQNEEGKAGCKPAECAPGTWGNIETGCFNCTLGRYNPARGAALPSNCAKCPEGRWGDKPKATCKMRDSPPRTFHLAVSGSVYVPFVLFLSKNFFYCLSGLQKVATNTKFPYSFSALADCKLCPQGTFGAEQGITLPDCSGKCKPGTFSRIGMVYCLECSPGQYSNASGAVGCTACPTNTTSIVKGASGCVCAASRQFVGKSSFATTTMSSPASSFIHENSQSCRTCPLGASCSKAGMTVTNMEVAKGYVPVREGEGDTDEEIVCFIIWVERRKRRTEEDKQIKM